MNTPFPFLLLISRIHAYRLQLKQEARSVTESVEVTLQQQSQSMGGEPDLVGGRTANMMAEYEGGA